MFNNTQEIFEAICREVCKDPTASTNGFCPHHKDNTASLSVDLVDGNILIKCHAGCPTEEVVRELGFEMSDLFRDKNERRKHVQRRKANLTVEQLARAKKLPADFIRQFGVTEKDDDYYGHYVSIPYFDFQKTQIVAERKRLGVKGGDSKWRKGDKPPLYAQWALPKINELRYCIFCEGESDTWTLWHHGYPALGLPGASTVKRKLQYRHVERLERIWVFIEPDRGGATVADHFPRRLKELGWQGELFRVFLPNHKDPNDLHKAVDGSREEFRRVFQKALDEKKPLAVPCPSADLLTPARGTALTDMGNGERLAMQHGDDIRYVCEWKAWLHWDGNRWNKDRNGELKKKAKSVVRTIYSEAAKCDDDKQRKSIREHAQTSEANGRVEAMIKLAEVEPGVPMLPEQFDTDPWLMTVKNGTIDLKTGKLISSKRENYITRCAPVTFDPNAECPVFVKFLETIFMGNENLIRFIQRAVGYTLTGRVTERCLFILHGCGKNGKSTLLDVIMSMSGEAADSGYGLRTPTETLMVQYGGGSIPNDIARMKGARYISASESEEGHRLAEAKIKDLTGGDTISARFMRGEFFDFKPEFKLWLATNHKPTIRGTDNAIWDRIRLIPFEWRVPDGQADASLPDKLRGEIDGVFQWALRGCLEWQKEGLGAPDEVVKATSEYRAEMDLLSDFISDCCTVNPICTVSNKNLYAEYRKWCEQNAQKMMSHKKFSQRLQERGLLQERDGKNRKWSGIGLITDEEFYQFGNDKSDGCDTCDTDSHISKRPYTREKGNGKTVSHPSHPSQDETDVKLSDFD